MTRARAIFWDWNGTLLDDVEACVDTLNTLLGERGLPAITRADYTARFAFPVRDFYAGLGFDFAREDFAALSVTFIERYRARLHGVALHGGALDWLGELGRRGLRQRVVSAMEHELLGRMLAEYGVAACVEGHHGTADLQAGSKVEIGRRALGELGLDAREVLIVGDTAHDHELAEALGSPCVLLAHGHQQAARLARTGRPVIGSLAELGPFVSAGLPAPA